MRFTKLLPLTYVALPLLLAQAPAKGDGNWPREIDTDSIHLIIYQPQVDTWKDDRIEARSAVIVTRNGDPTQVFGTVTLQARTEVDHETRLVTFEDVVIKDANFPTAQSLAPTLVKGVRESVANWPRTVSLDRLLADLAMTQATQQAETVRLKNDPPKILFSRVPAVLILIDGEPVYSPVQGTRYTRVINTPALLLFDSAAGAFYLDGGRWWMTASALQGPWTAAANPPQELAGIRDQFTQDEDKQPGAEVSGPTPNPPAVYVSTAPAELIITRGDPTYTPISKTNLLYVTNSDDDIFMDTKSQQHYVLLAGRWFQARTFEGPWTWVPGDRMPRDFTRISPDSPKGHVLVSIPGTEQAREAVIANQVPQTATVRRNEAKIEVRYQGAPQFRPIEGTSMEYAVNTSSEVIRADGRYYAVEHGVWFVANNAMGPWAVADMIPAAIYTIPPSNPLYHVRYVHVYGATPDVVYVGYTPGYLGAYVYDGVVVFGTGWWYPGWCTEFLPGPSYCYGWPWTWGVGFNFGYWGGGWFWRPAGHYWWYHSTPWVHRVFSEHWNPQWGTPHHPVTSNSAWIRGNVNAYSRWQGNAVVTRNLPQLGRVPGGSARPDLYAGKNGQVYQNRQDGWYRQDGAGQWKKAPANPSLNQQRDSRSLGQSRQREFERQGQVPGIPRTTAPPRSAPPQSTSPRSAPSRSTPSRPAAPSRGGGRR